MWRPCWRPRPSVAHSSGATGRPHPRAQIAREGFVCSANSSPSSGGVLSTIVGVSTTKPQAPNLRCPCLCCRHLSHGSIVWDHGSDRCLGCHQREPRRLCTQSFGAASTPRPPGLEGMAFFDGLIRHNSPACVDIPCVGRHRYISSRPWSWKRHRYR